MRFILTEGKNLEQTVQQYIDKYRKIVPAATDDMHRAQVIGIIQIDPTYKEGTHLTGDYAIWLLNMAIKNKWDVLDTRYHCEKVLTDFIDKKSLLKNKDINNYKSPEDLAQALSEVELTDRQKERRARNNTAMTKKVLSTDNWDIYMALNWEGALTLGKGTNWCTADSENAGWYIKYVMDYWHDENVEAFEVRNCEKEHHITVQELIDYPKFLYGKYEGEYEVTSEEEIYAQYSDRAVFVDVQGEGFFVNPYEKLEESDGTPYNRLFVFINKENGRKYQFCMSEDLASWEEDLEYTLTFCYQNDQAVDFRDFIGYQEKELRAFWTDVMGYSMQELFSIDPDEEEDIEESYTSPMKFSLVEGIADVRKHYQSISDDDFNRIIRLDPTFNENRDKVGTYGKWLLNLFNKGNLTNEGHVTDLLSRFEEEKPHLKNKDIGAFKSLDEVDAYLNDDNNYNSLTHRQEVRQRQKDRHNVDLSSEATLVYSNDEWEVWTPHTYAASCSLGRGTSWCTASTETDSYFNSYYEDGDLFININKKTGEKYQFHFESDSFMDAEDNPIDLLNFMLNSADLYYEVYQGLCDLDAKVEFLGGNPNGEVYYTSEKSLEELSDVLELVQHVEVAEGVTRIPDWEFTHCKNLLTVKLPSTLVEIGDCAFSMCRQLHSINIPSSVTDIGFNTFDYTSIESITIPDGVKVLRDNLFRYCGRLKDVHLGSGLTIIEDNVFECCSSLKSISLPSGLKSIGSYAFAHCVNLSTLNIPNSVQRMGVRPLACCNRLESVALPNHINGDELGIDVTKTKLIFRESLQMKFRLVEDITSVKKNFPGIEDEIFNQLIALDPTFNPNRDSVGTYGKWILTLYNKGEIKDEDWENVTQMLDVWETNKKRFTNKDIGQFKKLDQLETALLDMPDLELSHRQKVRQNQKNRRKADLGNEADLVFDGTDWEVWVPKTYAASCKLGQHTSWCTASTEDEHYFHQYSSQGKLYIVINKHDDKEKYQFQVETNSYVNSDDEVICLIDFLFDEGEELFDFFVKLLLDDWGFTPGIEMDDTEEIYISKGQIEEILSNVPVGWNTVTGDDCYSMIFDSQDWVEGFYFDTFYEEMLGDAIIALNEENKARIKELTGLEEITTSSVINYDNFLFEAFIEAIKGAYNESATYNVEAEAVMALEDAASAVKGLRADFSSNELVVKGTVSSFIELFREYQDYSDDTRYIFDDHLSMALGSCIIANYDFQKPRGDEWGELEDDLFNSYFESSLEDWFGGKEEQ